MDFEGQLDLSSLLLLVLFPIVPEFLLRVSPEVVRWQLGLEPPGGLPHSQSGSWGWLSPWDLNRGYQLEHL
jgi:hypothetical protein